MRPVVLVILDGWGIAPPGSGNAITMAKIPHYNYLISNFPHCLLEASGESVGLPRGEVGNTETGHLNIGAGFIVHQDLVRINYAIADGSFFNNPAFLQAINHARKYESNIHLIGLVGAGGVHANNEHLFALLQLLKEQAFNRVYIHLITDGRDSPPKSSLLYIEHLSAFLKNIRLGEIASIIGRYYALDRDSRWDRTKKAYFLLTKGIGFNAKNPLEAIDSSYKKGITDEFLKPTVIIKKGKPITLIKNNDSVIFFNFRIDRPRQLTKAFILDNFEKEANQIDFDPYAIKYYKKHNPLISASQTPFLRGDKLKHLYFVTMTEYSQNFYVSAVAFPPIIIPHPLGEVISNYGLRQLHISESEKERFVTYYFNGQRESPFSGESRLIIPSPKIATYDLRPQMSALEVTRELIKAISTKKHNFILVNFANPDMVAHTGNLTATIKACETIDSCLQQISQVCLEKEATLFITADHGNAEELINYKTNTIDTEHSVYPVPFIAISKQWMGKSKLLVSGILADIAPTILQVMHIKKPDTMTGRNLLANSLN